MKTADCVVKPRRMLHLRRYPISYRYTFKVCIRVVYCMSSLQDDAMTYWEQEGTPREKLILGLPLYGRGFRLEDPSNNGRYAPTNGGTPPGTYSRENGIASYYEVMSI